MIRILRDSLLAWWFLIGVISGMAAPRIDSVDWPMAMPPEEGRTVLIRWSGEGLTPDLTPEFLAEGAPVGSFSQFNAQGTSAGALFHIPVLRGLVAGALLPGELWLRTADGSGASVPFHVMGLPELVVQQNESLSINVRTQATFSSIRVEANARMRVFGQGAIDWRSTGPVLIEGSIEAEGSDGANAQGRFGAPGGRNSGGGGDGGTLNGALPPEIGQDGSLPLAPRRMAVSRGINYLEPAGVGGLAGHHGGLTTHSPCLRFPRFIGDTPPYECSDAIASLLQYGRLPSDHGFDQPMLAGAQGWSAVRVVTLSGVTNQFGFSPDPIVPCCPCSPGSTP